MNIFKINGKILMYIWIFVLSPIDVYAVISITVIGSWTKTVTVNDLQSGAGSDLISTYESATNVAVIDISGLTGDADNWRVDIRRDSTSWNSNLIAYTKRTSDGTGGGTITGGTVYVELTTSDQEFFSGSGNRSSINIQMKVSGVSLSLGIITSNSTITFTLVDTV